MTSPSTRAGTRAPTAAPEDRGRMGSTRSAGEPSSRAVGPSATRTATGSMTATESCRFSDTSALCRPSPSARSCRRVTSSESPADRHSHLRPRAPRHLHQRRPNRPGHSPQRDRTDSPVTLLTSCTRRRAPTQCGWGSSYVSEHPSIASHEHRQRPAVRGNRCRTVAAATSAAWFTHPRPRRGCGE